MHNPRSTGCLSASWIENGVSSPIGRLVIVATKNVSSSPQNRWNVATNCSTLVQRVATQSALVLVLDVFIRPASPEAIQRHCRRALAGVAGRIIPD
jgi:hypothetical protein